MHTMKTWLQKFYEPLRIGGGALLVLMCCFSLLALAPAKKKPVVVYLVGDSTMADYTLYENEDYMRQRYPMAGWGQVFQPFMHQDSLADLRHLIKADRAVVTNKAKGGRSTRTFFEEGRWAEVYRSLQKDDLVLIQFGHNDAAENKPERYTNITAYKEFLRLYVHQAREKKAIPVLLTPVARNYPWQDGKLSNVHGGYPQAMKEVAQELNVQLIDLTQLSMDHFAAKGQDYVTANYFMHLAPGEFEAYPEGLTDNTHFKGAGAQAVAQLVFDGLKTLQPAAVAKKR
jgi:lysophospholipase L1-like esterase